MNILILNGSPRANGNTVQLIEAFNSGLPQDAVCLQFDLYDLLPMPCVACGACMAENMCRFSDLDETDAFLHEADVIVWALPVYNYSVPAPVKALLDRFQRYYEAVDVRKETVFEKKDRPAVLLLSAGRTGLYSIDIIQKQLKNAGRYVSFALKETVVAANTDVQPVQTDILTQAADVAQRITS